MEKFIDKFVGEKFRFLVYKKMFTPFEQQQAYMDEDEFESYHYNIATLSDVFKVGEAEWMLELKELIDGEFSGRTYFFKLSDIRLQMYDDDDENCECQD